MILFFFKSSSFKNQPENQKHDFAGFRGDLGEMFISFFLSQIKSKTADLLLRHRLNAAGGYCGSKRYLEAGG